MITAENATRMNDTSGFHLTLRLDVRGRAVEIQGGRLYLDGVDLSPIVAAHELQNDPYGEHTLTLTLMPSCLAESAREVLGVVVTKRE